MGFVHVCEMVRFSTVQNPMKDFFPESSGVCSSLKYLVKKLGQQFTLPPEPLSMDKVIPTLPLQAIYLQTAERLIIYTQCKFMCVME